jgi:F-type H+-transporting ATPase subunit gamma
MANVLDLRRRIRSVKNTRQITKAMKMVSAARLRRAQERALASRPYSRMLTSVLQSLAKRVETGGEGGEAQHPLLVQREEKRILLVVISGEKGFAGAFNSNLLKMAFRFLESKRGTLIDIEPIGRKGRDAFGRRYPLVDMGARGSKRKSDDGHEPTGAGDEVVERKRVAEIEITGDHTGMLADLKFSEVAELSDRIVKRYESDQIDSVYLVYNEFKSVISQRVVVEKLLPIARIGEYKVETAVEQTAEERAQAGRAAATAGVSLRGPGDDSDGEKSKLGMEDVDYIYEQPPSKLFEDLLPRYITTQIFHAMLESVAAEHAARMTAMDAATSNASDMIDALTLLMNRVRQAAITKELIEIVSGAAALQEGQ